MRLTSLKKVILKAMADEIQPLKAKDIAKKVGLSLSPCLMHVQSLKKAGYIFSPAKGCYAITDLGRTALKPQVSRKVAKSLLQQLPKEKMFYFYTGLNQYVGIRAASLSDFCEKIEIVPAESVKFHLFRKDFERWLKSLGDQELANKLGVIRNAGGSKSQLQKSVFKVVKARCNELVKLA